MSNADPTMDLPQARVAPQQRSAWIWLLPLLAAIFAAWLGYHAWIRRGVVITVLLDAGHGLEVGAEVRYSGIAVGQVRAVQLAETLDGVVVTAALHPQASRLARAGARFWVVRPQLGVTGVAGLETVVGPRYLAMLPGQGPPRRHFLGLNEAPIVDSIDPGDLEIVLQAPRRGSLRPGAPVWYRQVQVGTVLSVGLTSDAGGVESRVHIDQAYTQLIRPETRFWSVGGFEAQLGIRGMTFEMESLEAILAGGVALATPPGASEVVRNGHRFALELRPREEWFGWEPVVAVGSSYLPPGSMMPAPLRAVVGWQEGRWLKSRHSRRGWVLQTEDGVLGPANLLEASGDRIDPETIVLEVAGRPLPLRSPPLWSANGLAKLQVQVTRLFWPSSLQRVAEEPEDCLAVGDPAATPLPLSASRLSAEERVWLIDPAVSIDPSWHGASVLSRQDGQLVGLMLVSEDVARVALLPRADQ